MRKPWIVTAMVGLLAIGGVFALGMTAQPSMAADTTTTAPAAGEDQPADATAAEPEVVPPPAETTEPAGTTAAEPEVTPAPAETTQPAETTEPAETAAEPAVEPAPDAAAAEAPEPEEGIYPDDRILGSRDAPITMIEYASLSCPHCAAFHSQVMPQLKSDYIDKGQVRFIYRDFPTNWPAVQGALLAHCAPDDARYFGIVDTLFKLQNQWLSAKEPDAALMQIGALAGMNKEKVAACFADKAMQEKIVMRQQEGEAKYGVRSTPSFVINGKLYSGGQNIEMLQEIFKELAPTD